MDNVSFTSIVRYTIGRSTLEALVKGSNPGANRDNIILRLEIDEEARELLAPLFAPEDPEPKVNDKESAT